MQSEMDPSKKGKVQLFNRGIQTKKVKQKERNIQTDF